MLKSRRSPHVRGSAHHPPLRRLTLRPLVLFGVLLAVLAMLPVGTASAADDPVPPPPGVTNTCTAKQIFYQFQYNDSDTVGIDKGCAEKNEVTRAINPDLVATSPPRVVFGQDQRRRRSDQE